VKKNENKEEWGEGRDTITRDHTYFTT